MRYLGLLGGMSWESTVEYYRQLNTAVAARMGGLHSAPLLLHSVDFAKIAELQEEDNWAAAGALLAQAARGLAQAGAEALVVCTNTMHAVAPAIEETVDIPLIHIVDVTGAALQAAGIRRAGLLGTRYTMEQPFWRERLQQRCGIELVVPAAEERVLVHRVIFEELCRGIVTDASRAAYVEIIEGLAAQGAEAVILGCTEIGLLVNAADSPLPVFDTTAIHVEAAVEFILGQQVC
ncbi:MAG: aspartate/glutamate racemase family protein [Gammaproteobacteria bacterium]|jgi:aspartate racemase